VIFIVRWRLAVGNGWSERGADGLGASWGRARSPAAVMVRKAAAVPGQVAADAKSNEIPAVRELLKAFTDLAGAVITVGALHTQSDTAQAITGRHADYVMTVKASMPALDKQLKKLPWIAIPRPRP
jgi:alkanesulfonate monooxygenase SsuD/methylene tetrahydromethanopterin reductase-like flavin-dependent oxidoreductase (luciferase family)